MCAMIEDTGTLLFLMIPLKIMQKVQRQLSRSKVKVKCHQNLIIS